MTVVWILAGIGMIYMSLVAARMVVKATRVSPTKWRAVRRCAKCKIMMSFNVQMYSHGVCPRCGNTDPGTIVDCEEGSMRLHRNEVPGWHFWNPKKWYCEYKWGPEEMKDTMFKRYRKTKPAEAVQITQDNIHELCELEGVRMAQSDIDAKCIGIMCYTIESDGPGKEVWGKFGDWLMRGVKGELYPCAKDVFAESYEPAE
jgi:hypothetical protein